jgi:acyl carrier protein
MISDEDFYRLFNAAASAAKPFGAQALPATQMTDRFEELGIDSLDGLIMGLYLCDAFAVPETEGKEMQPETVGDMRNFLVRYAQVAQVDIEKALEVMK